MLNIPAMKYFAKVYIYPVVVYVGYLKNSFNRNKYIHIHCSIHIVIEKFIGKRVYTVMHKNEGT